MQIFSLCGRPGTGRQVRGKILVLAALSVLAGCGMQPYDPPNNREYPAGPGLFSGKDGDFVIYRKQEPAAADPADEAAVETVPTDESESYEQLQKSVWE